MMIRDYLRKAYRTLLPLLFAKKEYKFFMASNLFDLEEKLQRVVLSTNLMSRILKPILVHPPFGDRVLVVAPHHDDEAIGCGGAILSHINKGGEVKTVIVQDGSGAQEAMGMSRDELISIRESESTACAEMMGIRSPVFLRSPQVSGKEIVTVAEKLKEIVSEYKPNTIFCPSVLDHHDDHRNSAVAVALALEDVLDKINVYSYEVWGLCIPNVVVSIDDVFDIKCKIINCFKSQVASNDYAHAFKGLAMYNSLQLGAIDVKYVERFFVLPRGEFVNFIEKITGE